MYCKHEWMIWIRTVHNNIPFFLQMKGGHSALLSFPGSWLISKLSSWDCKYPRDSALITRLDSSFHNLTAPCVKKCLLPSLFLLLPGKFTDVRSAHCFKECYDKDCLVYSIKFAVHKTFSCFERMFINALSLKQGPIFFFFHPMRSWSRKIRTFKVPVILSFLWKLSEFHNPNYPGLKSYYYY